MARKRYPYQHMIDPSNVPFAPAFTAAAPENVLNSPDLRSILRNDASVILHPTRGTIHYDSRQHPLSARRFTYSKTVARLANDDAQRSAWQPVKNWMRPGDNFGPFVASEFNRQAPFVRLMADGTFQAAEAFIEREREFADYGRNAVPDSQAYVGAEIDVPAVVEHLRVIKMFPELLGRAPMEFHVAKGFRSEAAPWLDFRIAARDPVVQKNFRMGPSEEPERVQSRFYESFLTCRKDRELIAYPDETRLRATEHDPLTIDRETAAYSLAFKRNLACIMELNQIGNRVGKDGNETTSDTLSEISARSNGKSVHNPLKEFQAIITRQFLIHRVRMTKWFMNPITFLHITQNDNVRSGGEFGRTPVSIPYGGMIQMPTMPGIDILCDARLPSDRIFMADNRQLLWLGEGPKKVETIDQRIRQQVVVDFTDYYDAFCIHRDITDFTNRRFGCTVFTATSDQ